MDNNDDPNRLNRLLAACTQHGASDLHLTPGLPPFIRIQGELQALAGETKLDAAETLRFTTSLKISDLGPKGSRDGALSTSDGTRYRFNAFRRQNETVLVFRRLEDRFRALNDLGLSESLYALCDLRDGLVIVSGPTGAGKSTTLATLIDKINQTRNCHIVTIEDPIEYIHKPVRSVVNQRQIGMDAPTFNDALVASLRQDPDVILVGEIRDLDTIRTAITAAETGHLVFTTLHAGDCVSSIERLVSVFPANEQDGVRRQLSIVLRAIVAQHLVAVPDTASATMKRIAASEVLMVNSAVAHLIAAGRSNQIYSTMEAGQSVGMQTLEQDLARLWVGGKISEITAVGLARNPATVRDRAAMLRKRNIAKQLSTGGGR